MQCRIYCWSFVCSSGKSCVNSPVTNKIHKDDAAVAIASPSVSKEDCNFMAFSSGQVTDKESHLLTILRPESPKLSSSLAESNTILMEEEDNDEEGLRSNLEPGEIPEALSEEGNELKIRKVHISMYFYFVHWVVACMVVIIHCKYNILSPENLL